jgi:hypothetical protein
MAVRLRKDAMWRRSGKIRPKLFIATPCNTLFPFQYVESITATWRWLSDKYDLGIGFVESALVYANRNKLFEQAYKDNVDYMLFVDSDMDWRPEMIHKMVQFDKDVVTGVCLSRKPMVDNIHLPALFEKVDDEYRTMSSFPDTPFKVDASGLAFMLLKKNVIKKMTELIPTLGVPFDHLYGKDVGVKRVGNSDLMGEDISFCYRLNKAGFEILCLPEIKVGHVVQFSLGKGE